MAAKRQTALAKALRSLAPQAPFYDAEQVRARAGEKHLRGLAPEAAVWLALIAYIRHSYTHYDALRDEGYERDSARYFVHADINAKLQQWRATRFLIIEEEDSAPQAGGEGIAD